MKQLFLVCLLFFKREANGYSSVLVYSQGSYTIDNSATYHLLLHVVIFQENSKKAVRSQLWSSTKQHAP